jgi:myosin heavy subunit
MLTRVCLIAAIVFGVSVATINLWKVREVIDTTRTELNTTSNNLYTTTIDLNNTKRELEDTKDDLAQTKQNLETTTAERDRFRNENDALTKQNNTLQQNLKKTTEERNEAQANLAAWEALGITVDQVKTVIATAKATEEALQVAKQENHILDTELKKAKNKLALLLIDNYKVQLPPDLKGTVLVADPKWEFVVLNIGEEDGLLEQGELLVNRDGRLVAKVRVQSVQKDRAIANMMDGWKLGDVAEGDLVIPAL